MSEVVDRLSLVICTGLEHTHNDDSSKIYNKLNQLYNVCELVRPDCVIIPGIDIQPYRSLFSENKSSIDVFDVCNYSNRNFRSFSLYGHCDCYNTVHPMLSYPCTQENKINILITQSSSNHVSSEWIYPDIIIANDQIADGTWQKKINDKYILTSGQLSDFEEVMYVVIDIETIAINNGFTTQYQANHNFDWYFRHKKLIDNTNVL